MNDTDLRTEHLTLILRHPSEVLTWLDSLSPSDRAEVSPDWIARLRASSGPDPWTCGYAMVHRDSGDVVGSCAYKGPPDADGVVEIAYGVDPEHQCRGYATEAAFALTRYAFDTGRVRTVRAHTLRENNASTRVLSRCGFELLGEVVDPEDGLVWRWEVREATFGRTP
jgi:[ribosomal protein S5]-alanine N-acetyltransferase